MPATSEKQASAAKMALAAKKGHISPTELYGAALQMYRDMSVQELEHFTKVKK